MVTPTSRTTPTADAGATDAPPTASRKMSERIRAFLGGNRFATLATVDPDGRPQQAVIWYRLEGEDIVINSRVGRRWPTNLERDPRSSLAISDQMDGYRWVGLSGIATMVDDQPTAQADIAEMARRYHADDPTKAERLIREEFETQSRVSFRIALDAVHDHLDD